MNTLVKGTIENVVVDLTDQLGALTTLTGANGTYDVRERSGQSWFIQNQPILNDDMRAFCLVDTTGAQWGAGFYELFMQFENAPERPRIGPIPFEIAHEMPEGPLSTDLDGVSRIRANYNHVNSVSTGVYTYLNWGTSADEGDEILDLTDPTQPKFIIQGVYAIAVTVFAFSPPFVGKWGYVGLTLVNVPDDFQPWVFSSFTLEAPTPEMSIGASLNNVSYCSVDSVLSLNLMHDAGADVSFGMDTLIQRIT